MSAKTITPRAGRPGAAKESWVPSIDFDLSPMSALLIDADSLQVRAANSAAEALYGYAGEEMLALSLGDIVDTSEGRHPVAAHALPDGSVVECEVQRHRRHDGSAFPALCASRAVNKGGRELLVINTFDASELRLGPAINIEVVAREETAPHLATILVVDDEQTVRASISRTLRRCGYEVLEASDGEDALRVLQDHHEPIPLVISDLMMPTLGGAELIDMLHGWYPGMRVLFISGYGADELAAREELAQCSFLAKPFTMGALTERVTELLEAE